MSSSPSTLPMVTARNGKGVVSPELMDLLSQLLPLNDGVGSNNEPLKPVTLEQVVVLCAVRMKRQAAIIRALRGTIQGVLMQGKEGLIRVRKLDEDGCASNGHGRGSPRVGDEIDS